MFRQATSQRPVQFPRGGGGFWPDRAAAPGSAHRDHLRVPGTWGGPGTTSGPHTLPGKRRVGCHL